MKKHSTFLLLFLCIGFWSTSYAQPITPFWEEDFSDGFPDGWITGDLSGNNLAWTWCGDPATGQATGCPPIWDDGLNLQEPFASATADNGFMTMDSDLPGELATDHQVFLMTDALSAVGQDEVYLAFDSHIGVFTVSASAGALVQVSTDSMNWVDFFPFPNLVIGGPNPGFTRWSFNPEEVVLDISSVAANQPEFYIRWNWNGNWEYHWSIDDIQLLPENPIPLNDMRVNGFYSIAPNAQVPASQVDEFGFLADIQNKGQLEQPNVNLSITIEDVNTNDVVYFEELSYGNIASDSLAENVLFASSGFTPPAQVADYRGIYAISSDSTDLDPSNNTQEFTFSVTDSVFAKENAIAYQYNPPDGAWDAGEAHSFRLGCFYYTPNGGDYFARHISFGFGTIDQANIDEGASVQILLHEWIEDTNGDDIADNTELGLPVAFQVYELTGNEVEDSLYTFDLINFENPDDPIALKDGGQYMAIVEYISPGDDVNLEFSASREFDYAAHWLRHVDSLGLDRWNSGFIGIGSEEFLDAFFFATPVVRLHISEFPFSVNTTELPDADQVLLFPNPASDQLHVQVNLSQRQSDVQIQLMDIQGRVLQNHQYSGLQQEHLSFDISHFPSGIYLLRFNSGAGMRTQKFIVE